ncbi:MAG: hypothetical protein AABW73_03400 [Nanoarchaeota archaeon]
MVIAVIRITGQVGLNADVKETLFRWRMRKKYVCVLVEENRENDIVLKRIRNLVAFGKINDETLKKLVTVRAERLAGVKLDHEKVFKEAKIAKIVSAKPFFRLHPPIGGADTKVHFPKGILGDNGEDINKLLMRMIK